MNISNRFNGFYHGPVLTALFERCGTLRFPLWIDDETGGVFEFVKGKDFSDMDDLKDILKNLNIDYAANEKGDAKISTTEIESAALCQHIEWVIALAAENNVTFDFIEDEWTRLLNDAGIRR